MRILLLVHSFNSLSQRLYVELAHDGHELSLELDIHDRVTREAVALCEPDVILAPFLKRAIPPSIWRQYLCLIVHPGPPGDRGPSALDWAILRGVANWGVTVLQATAEMDAGPVWGSASFPMRVARKSSLYRNEVTEAAVSAVRAALARVASGAAALSSVGEGSQHGWQPPLRQAQCARSTPPTAFLASRICCSIGASDCSMHIRKTASLGDPACSLPAATTQFAAPLGMAPSGLVSCSLQKDRNQASNVLQYSHWALWRNHYLTAMTNRSMPGTVLAVAKSATRSVAPLAICISTSITER